MISAIPAVSIDEFAGDEYAPTHMPLPYLQILNHQDSRSAGLFLSSENAAAVNFQPTAEWQTHRAQFFSGGSTMGYLSLTVRLVVLRRSPLLMFGREDHNFMGVFDRSHYDVARVMLKTRYLVYLVNRQKQLLHDRPLQFTAKGSMCGCFGEHYAQFRAELNRAYGKPRGDRFFAMAVFAFKLMPMLKGREQKAWVCSIKEHGVPTFDNWQAFFLGYEPTLKAKLLADFDAYADFVKVDRDRIFSETDLPLVDEFVA